MLQMLAPLLANPNPKIFGETIISNSAKIGQRDLIKILAPLNTNNLKAADTNGHEWFKGFTPIHHAAYFGHIEIIKTCPKGFGLKPANLGLKTPLKSQAEPSKLSQAEPY